LLFDVILGFVDIHSVLSIYGFCDDMYAHYSPRGSVLRSSAAQRVDGDLTVRAPGFPN